MRWVIERELKFNGKKVKALVPNPKTSRKEALERFEKLIGEVVKRRVRKVSA